MQNLPQQNLVQQQNMLRLLQPRSRSIRTQYLVSVDFFPECMRVKQGPQSQKDSLFQVIMCFARTSSCSANASCDTTCSGVSPHLSF